MTRALASALVCVALAVAPVATGSPAQSPAVATALRSDPASLKFGVIGDTGTGGQAQYDIAALLARARERFPFEFVIMLGDNMYGGESARDFTLKFEHPYKALLAAGVTFHAALGNHDDPEQRFYPLFNMNGQRYYTFRRGPVEFFVLDSTHMTGAQETWLRTALEQSTAPWKIAYLHHPLYSSGMKHGPDVKLRDRIEPLFLKHGVSVVFAGHEHFYERVKPQPPQSGIAYFTMGGSARLRKGNIDPRSGLTEKGFDTDNTFMLVEILEDRLAFDTISRRAAIVDSGTLTRRWAAATR